MARVLHAPLTCGLAHMRLSMCWGLAGPSDQVLPYLVHATWCMQGMGLVCHAQHGQAQALQAALRTKQCVVAVHRAGTPAHLPCGPPTEQASPSSVQLCLLKLTLAHPG